jgi:hypothetical protein
MRLNDQKRHWGDSMIGEIITISVLVGIILYQGWMIYDERAHSARIESELLDRLMAREYSTYIQGEVAKEQVKKPLTPEEIYDMQQERGIPV